MFQFCFVSCLIVHTGDVVYSWDLGLYTLSFSLSCIFEVTPEENSRSLGVCKFGWNYFTHIVNIVTGSLISLPIALFFLDMAWCDICTADLSLYYPATLSYIHLISYTMLGSGQFFFSFFLHCFRSYLVSFPIAYIGLRGPSFDSCSRFY